MTTRIRTAVLGVLAGAAASLPLALCLGHPLAGIAFGLAIGLAYAASTRRTPQAYVDNLMAGGALGVPLWGLHQRRCASRVVPAKARMDRGRDESTLPCTCGMGSLRRLAR